jgi:hypothetical protein
VDRDNPKSENIERIYGAGDGVCIKRLISILDTIMATGIVKWFNDAQPAHTRTATHAATFSHTAY